MSRFWAPSPCGTNVKVNGRFTRVPKFSTGVAKDFQACPKFRSLHRSSYRFEPILATLRRARWRRATTAVRCCRSRRRPVEPAQPQRRIQPRAVAAARALSEAEKLASLTQRRSTGGNARELGDSVSSNFQGGKSAIDYGGWIPSFDHVRFSFSSEVLLFRSVGLPGGWRDVGWCPAASRDTG